MTIMRPVFATSCHVPLFARDERKKGEGGDKGERRDRGDRREEMRYRRLEKREMGKEQINWGSV